MITLEPPVPALESPDSISTETTVGAFLGMPAGEDFVTSLYALLGAELPKRREALGISQTQAAERCHISQPRYSKLEKPSNKVSLEALIEAHVNLGATAENIAAYCLEAAKF